MTNSLTPTVNDLGKVVRSARARAVIYGGYVVALVLTGAVTAAFASLGGAPEWLGVVNSVLLYLGVPVGTLAAVNTTTSTPASPAVTVVNYGRDENASAADAADSLKGL